MRNKWLFKRIVEIIENPSVMIIFDFELECAGEMISFKLECGDCEDSYTIAINPILGNTVQTLIHECFHIIYPELKDVYVERLTIIFYRELSETHRRILEYLLEKYRW